MSTYVVRFSDSVAKFSVVIGQQNGLDNIALAIKEAFAGGIFSAGDAAARFIYWASDGKDCFLVPNDINLVYSSGQLIEVDVCSKQVQAAAGRSMFAFRGTVEQFQSFATADPLLGKTVVFRYTSGSAVGNRVVKVEKIEKKRGTVYYCGKDLKKGEYRCYDRRHIDGDILVLGEDGSVEAA